MRRFITCSAAMLALAAGQVFALPSLQLGPDPSDGTDWDYTTVDDTWVYTGGDTATIAAYANADPSVVGSLNVSGQYAWDDGDMDRYAYLVVSAIPDTPENPDPFDVTVDNGSGALMLFTSGYGTPPVEDPNSIADHGIFDTYFEIYEFQFNELIGTIVNTTTACSDPACTPGSGLGYTELFDITINSIIDGVDAIHFDLFTISGGEWDLLALPSSECPPDENGKDVNNCKSIVNAVAPYSHDAEISVPEPGSLTLLGAGLVGLGLMRRLRRQS